MGREEPAAEQSLQKKSHTTVSIGNDDVVKLGASIMSSHQSDESEEEGTAGAGVTSSLKSALKKKPREESAAWTKPERKISFDEISEGNSSELLSEYYCKEEER